MVDLERKACLSFYNHHHQDMVSQHTCNALAWAMCRSHSSSVLIMKVTCSSLSVLVVVQPEPPGLLFQDGSRFMATGSDIQGAHLTVNDLICRFMLVVSNIQEADLTSDDLELMCKLGSLLLSRSSSECISHSASLQQAKDLAAQWLHPTAEPLSLLDDNTSKLLLIAI